MPILGKSNLFALQVRLKKPHTRENSGQGKGFGGWHRTPFHDGKMQYEKGYGAGGYQRIDPRVLEYVECEKRRCPQKQNMQGKPRWDGTYRQEIDQSDYDRITGKIFSVHAVIPVDGQSFPFDQVTCLRKVKITIRRIIVRYTMGIDKERRCRNQRNKRDCYIGILLV